MALVFISHAHGDEALVRSVVTLLRDGLDLKPDEFFVSSQGGRGVAPSANIREQVLNELARTPALVVVVTPKSAGRPWVWLEAGNRLGRPDRKNPIFVVPAERFLPLVSAVADLRSLKLDHEDDLHEFVKAVGACLERAPQEALAYSAAIKNVTATAAAAYGSYGSWQSRFVASMRNNAALLAVATALVVATWAYGNMRVRESQQALAAGEQRVAALQKELEEQQAGANEAWNEELSRTAARYLVLKGVVLAAQKPIPNARVAASFDAEVSSACEEPACTWQRTTSAGEFRLDLTKIRAQNGDDIVLSVSAPGFQSFSKQVRVDVRAIDSAVPAQSVALMRAGAEQE